MKATEDQEGDNACHSPNAETQKTLERGEKSHEKEVKSRRCGDEHIDIDCTYLDGACVGSGAGPRGCTPAQLYPAVSGLEQSPSSEPEVFSPM